MTAPPREPTPAMFIAGTKALAEADGSFARVVWYAMYDAAPNPAPAAPTRVNQCDGCAQGLELRGWSHYKNGLPWMQCAGWTYDAPAPEIAPHVDDLGVDRFAAAMKAKLAKKRAEGYGGWNDADECPPGHLAQLLRDHLRKGDPLDIGNFAMMLWNRGESCATPKTNADRLREWVEEAVEYVNDTARSPSLESEGRALLRAKPAPAAPAPDALTFDAFRAANVARFLKWHPEGIESWSPSDWLVAVTGELGELASLLKMRNRERDGLPGNKFSPTDKQVADEIADVLTYLDLLAAVLHVDMGAAAVSKFNEVSERVGFPDRITIRSK